jgi:hypothetical protein
LVLQLIVAKNSTAGAGGAFHTTILVAQSISKIYISAVIQFFSNTTVSVTTM